jgi:hypothetical protein
MKKWSALAVLCVLVIGAVIVLILSRSRSHPDIDGAALVGSDMELLIQLRDIDRSLENWKATSLAKIIAEPEMQAFLQKPLSKVRPKTEFPLDTKAFIAARPGAAFLAGRVGDNGPVFSGAIGFAGDRGNRDRFIQSVRRALENATPGIKRDLARHGKIEIETFTASKVSLAFALVGDIWFFANDAAGLTALIEAHNGKRPQQSLARDSRFQAARKEVTTAPDLFVHLRTERLVKRLETLLMTAAETVSEEQLAELRSFKSVTATTSFDGSKIRDTVFIECARAPVDPLTKRSLQFASADTLLYHVGRLDLPDEWSVPPTANAGLAAVLRRFASATASAGLSGADFDAAFGPEYSFLVDWPAQSVTPGLLLTVGIEDEERARKIEELLISGALSGIPLSENTLPDGTRIYESPPLGQASVAPAIAEANGHLLLGLNAASIQTALTKTDGLRSLDRFKAATESINPATDVAGYVDLRQLFERSYGTIRPMIMMWGALMPGLNETIDVTKLPATETISRHLEPLVYSQTSDARGVKMQSMGTVSLNQVGVLTFGGAIAASVTAMREQTRPQFPQNSPQDQALSTPGP